VLNSEIAGASAVTITQESVLFE